VITYDSSQFAIWEATVQRRQAANEVVRQQIVTALLAWLDTREADFDIKEA